MAQNTLDALRKLLSPQSTYPGYDATTAGDPSYQDWSAQRPELAGPGGGRTVPTTVTPFTSTGDLPVTPAGPLTAPGGGQVYGRDPAQLVQDRQILEKSLDDMKRRAFIEQTSGGTMVSGATPPDIAASQKLLDESPDFGVIPQQEAAATDLAGFKARLAGFPSAQAQAEHERQMEMSKITMPLQVEQAKAKAQQDLETKRLQDFLKLRSSTAGPSDTGAPEAPGGMPGMKPGTAPAPPAQSMSLMSILTGKGAPPYSSAKDWLEARAERLKYDAGFPTPFAHLAQEVSLSNLVQVQGIFPGIRGVQHLLDKFAEHQANWGHETPTATLQRLEGMEIMLSDAERSMDDPSLLFKTGPSGQLELAVAPQSIQRSKILLQQTRNNLNAARNILLQQYPGIEQALQQAASTPAAPASRFTRIE